MLRWVRWVIWALFLIRHSDVIPSNRLSRRVMRGPVCGCQWCEPSVSGVRVVVGGGELAGMRSKVPVAGCFGGFFKSKSGLMAAIADRSLR